MRGKESLERDMGLCDDSEQEEKGDEKGEEKGEEEQDDGWAAIPASMRLPQTRAAPEFEFLL